MSKLPYLAAFTALMASACSTLPPPRPAIAPPLTFAGHSEKIGPPNEKHGALSLSYRSILQMPPKLARKIRVIDFFLGGALLVDGRCLQLRHDSTTRQLTGASLSAEPSDCDSLIKHPRLVSGRCSADEKNVSIGTWRVDCRVTGRGRSLIVATKLGDPSSKLELASLDEELIAVGVIGLHNQGIVRTMGIRSDGTIALSYFVWFNWPYRAAAKGR